MIACRLFLLMAVLAGSSAAHAKVAEPRFHGIPTKCTVRKLEPKSAETIVLPKVDMPLVQRDGKKVLVPAEVVETLYHCEYQEQDLLGLGDRASDSYCYELRSTDSKKPFHWYFWVELPLGRFHFWTTSAGRSYLTCVSGFTVLAFEVGRTQDKVARFCDRVMLKKPATKEFLVGVAGLVGRRPFYGTGMNDTSAVVEVLSLDEMADGQFTIKFSGADASKIYTAISDPTAKGKWRLEKE